MKVLEFPTTLCRSILAEFSYVKKASGGGSKEVRKLRLCMDLLSTQDKLLRDKHKMFDKIHDPKAKAKFGVKMKTFKGLVSKGVVNRWFTISKGATALECAIEGMVLPTMLLYVLEKGAITMNGFKGPSSCNEVFDVAIKSYKDKYKDGKMFESFTFNGAWGTYSALAMVKQGGMNYSHVLKESSDIAEFVLGSLVDDEVEVFGKPCMKIRDTEVVEVSIMVEIPWDRKKRKKKVGLVCVVFGIPISLTYIDFGNKRKIGWGLNVSSGFDIISSGDEEHVADSTIPSVDDEEHVADSTLILVVEVKVTSINESVNEGELNRSMGSQLASCGGVGNELSEFSVGVKTGCVNNKKVKGEFVKQAIQWVDGNQLAAAEGCEEISVKNYEIDINVDLHNRQIVVYLRETTMRLFSSNVLSSGMHGLSNEIAKDLILDGVKFVTWYEERTIEVWDFSSYFIFTEDDGGKYRAPASVQKLQELNNDVGVHSLTVPDAEVAVALGSSVPLNTLTALVSDMCFEFNDDARTNKNPSTNQSSKETTKPPKFLKNVDAGIVKILPSKPMIVENFCEYNPLDYFDAMDMHEVAANGTIKSDDFNVSKFHLVDTKNSTCGSIEKWIVSRGSVTWTLCL